MSDKFVKVPYWLIEAMGMMNLNNKARWLVLWLLFNNFKNKGPRVYHNACRLNRECFHVTKCSLTAARAIKILEDLKMIEIHDKYIWYIQDHKKWNISDELKKKITELKKWYKNGD